MHMGCHLDLSEEVDQIPPHSFTSSIILFPVLTIVCFTLGLEMLPQASGPSSSVFSALGTILLGNVYHVFKGRPPSPPEVLEFQSHCSVNGCHFGGKIWFSPLPSTLHFFSEPELEGKQANQLVGCRDE